MKIDILTLFPEMFDGFLNTSIIKRARENGNVVINIHNLDAHALHGHGEQVGRTTVDGRKADEVLPRRRDVQHRHQARRLTGRRAHRTDTAFESGDFLLDGIHRRIGNTGVHMPRRRQVEQLAEMLGGVVFIRRALIDRQHARIAVFRLPTALDALGVDMIAHWSTLLYIPITLF